MSGSVNKVTLVGSLGADPEVKQLQDGTMLVNIRVATSQKWRSKSTGEQQEKVEWHRVTIWSEGIAKIAEEYLKKGSKVYLEGMLETRKWQAQDGTDRYSTEVVMRPYSSTLVLLGDPQGGRRREGEEPEERQGSYADKNSDFGASSGGARQPAAGKRNDMDDEIPFVYKHLDKFPP